MDARVSRDTTVEAEQHDEPSVSAHETAPGRTVLTEAGNTEGWIATDLTVDVWR